MVLNWSTQDWKDFGLGCFWVLLSFGIFRLMQYVVRWYMFGKCTFRTFNYFGLRAQDPAPADSRELTVVAPNKKWRISNELISLIHSVVSGLWAGYALLYYPKLSEDMANYRCRVAINLIFLSTGYLLHDLVDLLVNEQSARIMELLYHHFVVLSAFAVTMVTEKYLGVVIFGLLMELNSIFLHSRSLLNLYGYNKKSTAFRVIALLNMVTLLLFRLAVSVYLVYWAIINATSIVWYVAVITFLVILSLFVTNSILAYRVMAADGLLGNKRARKNTKEPAPAAVGDNPTGTLDGEEDDDDEEEAPHEVAVQTDVPMLVDSSTATPSVA